MLEVGLALSETKSDVLLFPAFPPGNGAGGRTRTYEAYTAGDLQSPVIATRRLQLTL